MTIELRINIKDQKEVLREMTRGKMLIDESSFAFRWRRFTLTGGSINSIELIAQWPILATFITLVFQPLLAAGHIAITNETQSSQDKRIYEITDRGREAIEHG